MNRKEGRAGRTGDRCLLKLRGVTRSYGGRNRPVTAVEGVSLQVNRGESLGLVGESGCGKSTLARLAVGLESPDRGSISFKGRNLAGINGKEMRQARRELQIVFQDCGSALNPRMTVGESVAEPMINFNLAGGSTLDQRVTDLFRRVGLDQDLKDRYPRQLSGGQRQRVGIARALAPGPELMVCDEPVSSLDVSMQAQIINLLMDLKESLDLSYLFISHDLAVVYQLCDRVAVMYLGRIVEILPAENLLKGSLHPYTSALVAAVPAENPLHRGFPGLKLFAEASRPGDRRGCLFTLRCPFPRPRCFDEIPTLMEAGGGHMVACHSVSGGVALYGKQGPGGEEVWTGDESGCIDNV